MNCTAIIFEGTIGAVSITTIFHNEFLPQINVEPLNILFFKIVDDLCANAPISFQRTFGIPKFTHLIVKGCRQLTDRHGFSHFWIEQVTPALFARFPTLESFAQADIEEVGEYVHSCGFFRAKSKDMVLCAQMLLHEYGGKVPGTMEDLLRLPGVGRKTANLILGDVHNTPGVVVADTHCIRISGRMGLTDGTKDPAKVEQQLRAVLPPEESNNFCHRLVLHGRAVCTARKAKCGECVCAPWCKYAKKEFKA